MADISQLLKQTLVLAAHPDDETLGCGALMQRMRVPFVVFATGGAPHDEYFWRKYGSRSRYQRVREDEARKALSAIEVTEVEFLTASAASCERITDQELYRHLDEAYAALSELIQRRRPDAILTSAYEGGHPDHDCCSILAAQAGVQYQIPVWEFPLYHRLPGTELTFQSFLGANSSGEVALELMLNEIASKRAMLNAYASQRSFLTEFDLGIEGFRPQPEYDYSQPPHAGALNYEAWGWRMTGLDVCAAYCKFAATHSAVML